MNDLWISVIHRTNIKGLKIIQKKTVYTEKQIKKMLAGSASKRMVDIKICEGGYSNEISVTLWCLQGAIFI